MICPTIPLKRSYHSLVMPNIMVSVFQHFSFSLTYLKLFLVITSLQLIGALRASSFKILRCEPGLLLCLAAIAALLAIGVDAQVTDAEVQRPGADLVSFSLSAHSSSNNGISALVEGSTRARRTGAGCWQGLGHTGMVLTTQTLPQAAFNLMPLYLQCPFRCNTRFELARFLKTIHSLQQTKPLP